MSEVLTLFINIIFITYVIWIVVSWYIVDISLFLFLITSLSVSAVIKLVWIYFIITIWLISQADLNGFTYTTKRLQQDSLFFNAHTVSYALQNLFIHARTAWISVLSYQYGKSKLRFSLRGWSNIARVFHEQPSFWSIEAHATYALYSTVGFEKQKCISRNCSSRAPVLRYLIAVTARQAQFTLAFYGISLVHVKCTCMCRLYLIQHGIYINSETTLWIILTQEYNFLFEAESIHHQYSVWLHAKLHFILWRYRAFYHCIFSV